MLAKIVLPQQMHILEGGAADSAPEIGRILRQMKTVHVPVEAGNVLLTNVAKLVIIAFFAGSPCVAETGFLMSVDVCKELIVNVTSITRELKNIRVRMESLMIMKKKLTPCWIDILVVTIRTCIPRFDPFSMIPFIPRGVYQPGPG